ncbi:MAG: hypothetical protein FJ026_09930 [Chloroflexi bacterium]|nr:hypothetical protein [Chloroflexota bacterium]
MQDQVWPAVQGLDAWFDTQRQPGGYGGPVVHWWRDCLDYTAPGLDWRYEGIICGYLNLWSATGEDRWLAKATRAGDDLVAGQLPSANYRNSSFELNPATAGTPHEAANDLALLRLAGCLRRTGQGDWQRYARTAERNLHEFFIQRLWDARARHFRDSPSVPSFVPNKAATLAEALLALSRCTGNDEWAGLYALPTLHSVLAHQVRGGALDGAICQNSFGPRRVDKFFPFYVARCIPGLLDGFAWSQDERLADGARHAAEFVKRCRYDDGSFPQVLYLRGLANRYPQWVAATGDILRAMALASTVGVEFDPQPTQRWLLAGLRADGGIHTALGFGRATPGGSEHDPRDQLSVCGWADKAFRYLTEQLPASSQQPAVKAQSIRP